MLKPTVQSTAWALGQCSQGTWCDSSGALHGGRSWTWSWYNPSNSAWSESMKVKLAVSSMINFFCAQEMLVPLKAMAEILLFSRVQEFPAILCLYKITHREWQTLQSFKVVLGNKLFRNPQVFYVVLCIISTNESALELQKKVLHAWS